LHHQVYEKRYEHQDEVLIIHASDIIVDPVAVVVEFSRASVADLAVFGKLKHVGCADVTEVLVL
jgi:hypothetical protein